MVTATSTPIQKNNPSETGVTLRGISWQTYKALMTDARDDRAWRIAYDQEVLEIRMPLAKHEEPKHLLENFIDVLTDELGIENRCLGALTLEREDLTRAIEPDSCFYIQNESRIRANDEIDLANDPPPDLVIESDYTSSSLNKFAIYASLGVPEIWRYHNNVLQIYCLIGEQYEQSGQSIAFPFLPVAEVPDFIEQGKVIGQRSTVRLFRERIQAVLALQA